MAIDDKFRAGGLPVGTRLAANYRKQAYHCTVVETEGVLVYVNDAVPDADPPYGGGSYKSISSAGNAFLQGKSQRDGWLFWSIEGEEPEPLPAKEKPVAVKTPRAPKAPKEPKVAKAKAPKAAKTSKAKSNGAKADGTAKTPRTRRTAKQEDPKVFVEGTDKYIYRKNAFAPNEFYCEGCLGKFTFEGPEGTEPADCPNGHVEAVRAQTA